MSDFATDIVQTEATASDLGGIHEAEIPSLSTKAKEIPRAYGDGDRGPWKSQKPSAVEARTQGFWYSCFRSVLSAILSLFLLCCSQRNRRLRGGLVNSNGSAASDLAMAIQAASSASDRFQAFQRDEDLDRCLESFRNVLALCQNDPPVRMATALMLGSFMRHQFRQTGNIADLDEVILYFQEGLALFPVDQPGRSEILNGVGDALGLRFDLMSNVADLEEGIHHLQDALELRPIGHPDRSETLNNLGIALSRRFHLMDNMADLEESIRHDREALSLCRVGDTDCSAILNNLGTSLGARFDKLGNRADLEEGIHHLQEALSLRPTGHLERPRTLNNLGLALTTLWKWTGDMANLEESINHLQEALSLCPIGHLGRSIALSNLCIPLIMRCQWGGDMADLEESIDHLEEALSLRPVGHPNRLATLNNLGEALSRRFDQTGSMASLEKSVHYLQEALSLYPIGHPLRSKPLKNLSTALMNRFEQRGNMVDLGESISHQQEALSLHLVGDSRRPAILNSIGIGLGTRFQRMGNMADLEGCIHHHQEALSLRPIGDPSRAATLTNLGTALSVKFGRIGNMADLEESIYHLEEALSLRPIGHPGRSTTLINLADALSARFERMCDMANVVESTNQQQEALTLHPIDSPSRPVIINSLGKGTRFKRMGNTSDLEESVHHLQEALSLHPIGNPGRSVILNNLGSVLSNKFDRIGNMVDLEESICHYQEALSLYPVDHPGRSAALSGLGMSLSQRFDRLGDMADLQESIRCCMDAVAHTLSSLPHRLGSAHNWINLARRNSLESLEEAYTAYMDLLDRSLLLAASSIQGAHSHMVQINKQGMGVVADSVSHAIETHQLRAAVEIAERGRALLFTQLGGYRIALDDLEARNKELAIRFRELSTALEESFTLSQAEIEIGDQVARRQRMAADWDHTVEEIRQLEGFEDFLGITPFVALQKAAIDGPVILVNISRYGSFAVIITATGDPLSVSLPEATSSVVIALSKGLIESTTSDLQESKSNQNLIEILRDLWTMIVEPIVFELESTLHLLAGSRIWWMPTSTAWWLPLHAAGPYKPRERGLSDRFVSSYTPNLSSLIRSREGYQPTRDVSGPRMLVVAQAAAEQQTELKNVEVEVNLIRQLEAQVTIIEGEDCTRDSVLAHLKDTDWIHFSCHGHQHPTEPFKSHFSVGTLDAPLTVLDIIRNGLPQAGLAVLSACHSAAGEKTTPDEVINLAAGILFAGFRSVIGTMWAMDDRDGPVVAQVFYKYMFRNGLEGVDCRDAAKALVMAVREVRRREVPLVSQSPSVV